MTTAPASPVIAPELHRSAGWVIALGVLQIIVGLIAIGSPLFAGLWIAWFAGFALLVGGVLEIIYAMRARSWGAGLMAIAGGLLAIVAGAITIAHPIFGLKFLTVLLMIYLAADGIARIMLAFQMSPRPGWGWALFGGIVTLLLAVIIWRNWPVSGAWAIGIVVGVQVLMIGWTHVVLGLAARAVTADAATNA